MLFSASFRTEVLTIFAADVKEGIDGGMRFSSQGHRDLRYLHDHFELVFRSLERKECPVKGSLARVVGGEFPTEER
jgi:hypothetical protein